MDGIHTGLHIATNQLSPVPKASLCRDVQTHTHTLGRLEVCHIYSFNYVVKLSPRCPSYSGEQGLGGVFGDLRQSPKWVKEDGRRSLVTLGKDHVDVLRRGRANQGPCLPLLLVRSPTDENGNKTRSHNSFCLCEEAAVKDMKTLSWGEIITWFHFRCLA